MLNKVCILQQSKNVYNHGRRFGRTKCYKKPQLFQEEDEPKDETLENPNRRKTLDVSGIPMNTQNGNPQTRDPPFLLQPKVEKAPGNAAYGSYTDPAPYGSTQRSTQRDEWQRWQTQTHNVEQEKITSITNECKIMTNALQAFHALKQDMGGYA